MATSDLELRAERKAHGRFYTPAQIALRLAELALAPLDAPDLRLIDPACGDGAFLRAARTVAPAATLLGVDRDPVACAACRSEGFEALEADALLSPLPGFFDVLLANPPYLSTKRAPFSEGERRALVARYRTARGQFDACALFVERALELLRPGGRYALLLPRAVLSNRDHQDVRRLLLEEGPPERLIDFGLAFAGAAVEVVGLVGQKRSTLPPAVAMALEDSAGHSRGQLSLAHWAELPGLRLPLRTSNAALQLRSRLARSGLTLGQVATGLQRGVELGQKAPILAARPGPPRHPVLRGRDVRAFRCAPAVCFLDPADVPPRKLKPLSLYDVPEKLVVRRVANRLIAAVDRSRSLALNTLYCVHSTVPLDALACVLNSTLATFWWRQSFGSDDRLFPYIRAEQLAALPLPSKGLETLAAIGARAAHGDVSQAEIDRQVEAIYGLDATASGVLRRHFGFT